MKPCQKVAEWKITAWQPVSKPFLLYNYILHDTPYFFKKNSILFEKKMLPKFVLACKMNGTLGQSK